jgi:hypothetical protein
MATLVISLIVIVALLLGIVVLIQNPKGGGLFRKSDMVSWYRSVCFVLDFFFVLFHQNRTS